MLTVVCGPVVVGELRGVLPGVVVGFAKLGVATNNQVFTEGATCVVGFPVRLIAWVFEVIVQFPGVFATLGASILLSSEEGAHRI